MGGDSLPDMPFHHSLAQIEEFAAGESISFQPKEKIILTDSLANQFPQRFVVGGVVFKGVVEAVRDRLLDWSVELEKRGITGENMSFEEQEKKAAHKQTFNIQNFSGVLGDITQSQVSVFDFSSIHQILKQSGIPQSERNKVETLLDELKNASGADKKSLIERGKDWVAKNEKFLGASASIVRKALGG